MEDKFVKNNSFNEKFEIFSILYDKNNTNFNEILIIEQITIYQTIKENFKVFKAYHSDFIGTYLFCIN